MTVSYTHLDVYKRQPQGRICHLVRKGQPLRHFFPPHSLSLPGERKFATHSVSLKPIAGIARYHWMVLIASSYPWQTDQAYP